MCGITGIVGVAAPCDREVLLDMTNALSHRGPDGDGFYVNGPVGLGHRRLSIIDLSPSGKQPMSNEDESIWITFNGEIYNFQDLRALLEAKGHRFRSNTDTETIVHLYEEHGEDCLQHLRGMFAFAIWDAPRSKLLIARDRIGKKPLVYSENDNALIFASEFQGLLQHPDIPREVDLDALNSYLTFGYIPAPRTAFKGIRKLPPGYLLTRQNGITQTRQYWRLDYQPKWDISEDEAREQLLSELRTAVRLRMISDVPLGAFLSGGLDSSAVVGTMSQLSNGRVKTFSIGFEEAAFNELEYARKVAQRFDTDHEEIMVRPDALSVLPTLVRHYGEPYADSSAVPSYYVARAARKHVIVALNGDGGDESFAGYERYLGNALAEKYRRLPALMRGMIESLGRRIPNTGSRRGRLRQMRRFLHAAARPFAERYLSWLSFFPQDQKEGICAEEFRNNTGAECSGEEWLRCLTLELDGMDNLDAVLWTDVHSYLPFDLLVKMDIASMANSLEARSPLLDHHVMEFAARLPSSWKIRGRTLKYLLKQSVKELLPAENVHRRKQGFGVPVGEWLRGELKELLFDVVLSDRALGRGYFKPTALRNLVELHQQKREDRTDQLWALLMLELWHREFIDANVRTRS